MKWCCMEYVDLDAQIVAMEFTLKLKGFTLVCPTPKVPQIGDDCWARLLGLGLLECFCYVEQRRSC